MSLTQLFTWARLFTSLDRTGRRSRRVRLMAVGTTVVGIACLPWVMSAARAEDTPTTLELLQACDGKADVCIFHPEGAATVSWTPVKRVGQTANCTQTSQPGTAVAWVHTTFSANSVGVSAKFMVGAIKAYMVGFQVTYNHEWADFSTDANTTSMMVPAGHMGQVFLSREMETVGGQFELHFGKRYYGHYYWYAPFSSTSPKPGGQTRITTASYPMTAQERAAYCRA